MEPTLDNELHEECLAPGVRWQQRLLYRGVQREGRRRDFTMRLGSDYVTKGSDWPNGSQGAEITFFVPSPSAKRHLFFREVLGIYRFYDTITDRNNIFLTREQMSKHHWNSFLEMTIMYRF